MDNRIIKYIHTIIQIKIIILKSFNDNGLKINML